MTAASYFLDMENDEYLSAALEMSEKEIMTYKLTGDRYTFEPTAEVSKVDFVVMLMTALDHEVDLNRSDAVFADLDKLSAGRRAYLAGSGRRRHCSCRRHAF